MRYAPKKIFISKEGEYIEINYDSYLKIIKEDPKRKFWLLGGMLLELPEEIYKTMNREKSRMEYLNQLSTKFGEFSYDSLTTEEMGGSLVLKDKNFVVEEIVEEKLLKERLYFALKHLSEEELRMINALYFVNMTESEFAKLEGISQVAVNKRKKKVLEKLKKII